MIFQLSRTLQVFLQRATAQDRGGVWRPSVVCLSAVTFENRSGYDLLRWIAYRYGFGTYIHLTEGYLSKQTIDEGSGNLDRLLRMNAQAGGNVFVDALTSPSYTTAVCQAIQLPGISGKPNNTLLFEFYRDEPRHIQHIIENIPLVQAAGLDTLILSVSPRNFGYRTQIHVWIKPGELENASLMILLAYVLLGHPDWSGAHMRIFVIAPPGDHNPRLEALLEQVRSGRLPISERHIERVEGRPEVDKKALISARSREADLCILGIQPHLLKHDGPAIFEGYNGMGDILFVDAARQIQLADGSMDMEEVGV